MAHDKAGAAATATGLADLIDKAGEAAANVTAGEAAAANVTAGEAAAAYVIAGEAAANVTAGEPLKTGDGAKLVHE